VSFALPIKIIPLLLCGTIALSLTCTGQLQLNTGETYTYQFDTLPLTFQFPPEGHFFNGRVSVSLNPATIETGDSLRLDMFENNLGEAPICSTTLSGNGVCTANLAWQDLQGVFRLTMLSGSVEVSRISLQVVTSTTFQPGAGEYDLAFTPVPEPSPTALLSVPALIGALWTALFRKRKSTN